MIRKNNNDENAKDMQYETAILQVQEKVDEILSRSPSIVRKYTNHLVSSKGKYIRAKSLIICAEDEQGKVHTNAVKLAVAIEILHLATLVHDDVIDDAKLRRGKLTLQKMYGKKTAVICGDYLLCTALTIAGSISNKQDYISIDLPNYMNKVCLGELKQHINNGNLDLSVYQYLKIISGKTAALFEASFYAGAYILGTDNKNIKKYRQLGYIMGMIFQLTDDCIDFESTEALAMKPVQSDFEQGVITLPLIHAFETVSDLRDKAAHTKITRNEIDDAVKISGGLVFTRMIVQRYYKKALHLIHNLEVPVNKKDKLIAILDKVSRLT